MGNAESLPKRRTAKNGRSSVVLNAGMDSNDLDKIHKFVCHVKQTSLGDHMLEEFVCKSDAVQLNGDHQREETFPIKSIQIGRTETRSSSTKGSKRPKKGRR